MRSVLVAMIFIVAGFPFIAPTSTYALEWATEPDTLSLCPAIVTGIYNSPGGQFTGRAYWVTGDTRPFETTTIGNWALLKEGTDFTSANFGSSATTSVDTGTTCYSFGSITTTTSAGSGVGSWVQTYSTIFSNWGAGNYVVLGNNMASSAGFPTFTGSSYTATGWQAFTLDSSGNVSNWSPVVPPDGVTITVPEDDATVPNPVPIASNYMDSTGMWDQFVYSITNESDATPPELFVYTISSFASDEPQEFSRWFPLVPGKTYSVYAYLQQFGGDVTTPISNIVDFSVSSGAVPAPDVVYEECDGVTDIFCQLRNFATWAFVPDSSVSESWASLKDVFATSFPFAYVADFYTLFSNADSVSPEMIPDLVLDLPFAGETTLFSSDTLEHFLPTDVANVFRGIIEMLLWLSFGYYIYATVNRFFSRETA